MYTIYSGKEVKRLLNESIPGYKPRFGNNASSTENEKLNKKANKDSIKNTKLDIPKEESKPVKPNGQSTDLGNNKNMLDLEFDYEPGKEYTDRVKKQVTGEDSTFGNKVDEEDELASNSGNKAFYDAAKKASEYFVDNKQKLQNSGIVGKEIPLNKKSTPFTENSDAKVKRLNFKTTQFLSEKHMFSLIPEDYKKDGSSFVMKDSINEEYLIEWKVDSKTNISEGIIINHENKTKLKEEFDRIKNLYQYKSGSNNVSIKNSKRVNEDYDIISENIKKLKEVSDN